MKIALLADKYVGLEISKFILENFYQDVAIVFCIKENEIQHEFAHNCKTRTPGCTLRFTSVHKTYNMNPLLIKFIIVANISTYPFISILLSSSFIKNNDQQ